MWERLAFATLLAAFGINTLRLGIHKVSEGHVGVYWRAGRLLESIGPAGINFMIPYLDHMEEVQITLQTDKVSNIPCGTSGGVIVEFSTIEVVNRLAKDQVINIIRDYGVNYDKTWIFDRVHHEINQFCSSHSLQEVYIEKFSELDEMLVRALQTEIDKYASGLSILSVRVTKPKIPRNVLENYEAMEAEKTNLMVAVQRANVERQTAETVKMKAIIQAEQEASVSLISKQRIITEREAERKIREIEDATFLHTERARADAEFYHKQKQAEANMLLYTPEFLQYSFAQSLASNTKLYFGNNIPTMLLENLPAATPRKSQPEHD